MFSFISSVRLALLGLALPLAATAQTAGSYTMVSSGGGVPAYTALQPNAMPATLTAGTPDEGYYNNIPLGFTFRFAGVDYTTVSASTNGFMTLGQALTAAIPSNNLTSGLPRPVIAPLWDDLSFTTVGSTPSTAPPGGLYYQTSGGTGSHVFTIEWRDVRWSPAAGGPSISMLVQLNEGSNTLAFAYLQGATSAAGSMRSASVGLAGVTSGDFLSLANIDIQASTTASNTVETPNSSRPTSGRKFLFTPGAPTATAAAATAAAWQMAPNPAREQVRLTGHNPALPVSLFDAQGRWVLTLAPAAEAVLDLRGLAKGLYLVRVGQSSRRLVVE